ncbi:MAG: sigma-54-dependent transcriptional regulator [Acidobacteriota bacterium]
MHQGKILLVDDEAGIRTSLTQVIADEGYDVEAVSTGEEGIERVRRGGYHLLLLDVWLPGLDGLAVLERLRATGIDIPVVMISGHASIDAAVKATKLGAFDFIEKPLTIDKITVAVRNALRQRQLEKRNRRLSAALHAGESRRLIGEARSIVALREQIKRAAPTNGRVLIFGENGTGKELVARMIHSLSLRSDEPFIEMNCAAIPEELIESELFGHLKGSFTGAVEDKKGKFELADQGTLFLDEIGDMSLKTQSKVLRVLQEQTFERVGGGATMHVDVRVLAATNKNLPESIKNGTFREDLFFRLNVIPLTVPPLRERRQDIPLVARHFMKELAAGYARRPLRFSEAAMSAMCSYAWPGNVRELRNVVERLVIMAPGEVIRKRDLPPELRSGGADPLGCDLDAGDPENLLVPLSGDSLKQAREKFERLLISKRLAQCANNVSRAAELLGMERSHLHRKMKAYGLVPDRGNPS